MPRNSVYWHGSTITCLGEFRLDNAEHMCRDDTPYAQPTSNVFLIVVSEAMSPNKASPSCRSTFARKANLFPNLSLTTRVLKISSISLIIVIVAPSLQNCEGRGRYTALSPSSEEMARF